MGVIATAPRMRQPQSMRSAIHGLVDPSRVEYHGVRMRSRLEAAFAAHLDGLDVKWSYEPIVFGKRGHGYLPDFRIDRSGPGCWVEVKPTLDQVPHAKERMTVIWDAFPDAVLIVACAEGSTFFASVLDKEWIEWHELWKHR